MVRALTAFVTALLTSCGGGGGGGNAASTAADDDLVEFEVLVALKDRELPVCNPARISRVLYSEDTKLFKVCDGSTWQDLDVQLQGAAGAKGDKGESGKDSLIVANGISSGHSVCTAGGSMFQAGTDENGNGILEASEIESTGYACNGSSTGASGNDGYNTIIKVSNESAGANCSAGGKKLESGRDNGSGGGTSRNGILEAGEVEVTSYVCNGSNGSNGSTGSSGFSSLILITNESAGANCPTAGKKVQSGLDNGDGGGTASDGTLQSGEVDSTAYVCNGATGSTGSTGSNGYNSLIKTTSEAAGSNCSNGGRKIESGLDNGDGGGTASNGTLEAGEVDATSYLCNTIGLKLLTNSATEVGSVVHLNYSAYKTSTETIVGYLVSKSGYQTFFPDYSVNTTTGARSSITTSVKPGLYDYYATTDCSGQAYAYASSLSQDILDFIRYSNFRFARGASTNFLITTDEITFTSTSTSNVRLRSYYQCASAPCTTIAQTTCTTMDATVATYTISVTSSAAFPASLSAGWYVSH